MTRFASWSLVAFGLVLMPAAAEAQQQITVTVPPSVTFNVTNVTTTTTASSVTVSYDGGVLLPGDQVRIEMKADASNFTRPSEGQIGQGTAIPATNVSWTIAGTSNGSGFPNSLATSYRTLFESNDSATAASVSVTFALSAPPSGIRSGSHTLTIRYRLSAF